MSMPAASGPSASHIRRGPLRHSIRGRRPGGLLPVGSPLLRGGDGAHGHARDVPVAVPAVPASALQLHALECHQVPPLGCAPQDQDTLATYCNKRLKPASPVSHRPRPSIRHRRARGDARHHLHPGRRPAGPQRSFESGVSRAAPARLRAAGRAPHRRGAALPAPIRRGALPPAWLSRSLSTCLCCDDPVCVCVSK